MNKIKYIKEWLRYVLTLVLFIPNPLLSNNIQVQNIILKNTNFPSQYTHVKFDLSWENSWRMSFGPSNWDAAWVFVKFRTHNNDWQHATLNYVNGSAGSDGHVEASGSTITTVPGGVGVFIHRNADGTGDIDWQGLQLRWNYGIDGVVNNAMIEVKVFAIEMVYVPQGNYLLGGGFGSEVGKFFEWTGPINFTIPYQVSSETAIPIGQTLGNLYYSSPSGENAGDQLGPIPATFPKGYDAFYCMKYEVTQEQWVDFFNTLTSDQKTNNDLTDLDHKGPNAIDRNSIKWDEQTGGAITSNPYVPVSFTQWSDIMAYMDWSGLRPMSELEYIKACRGPQSSVPEGYAWGTGKITDIDQPHTLTEQDTEKEYLINPVNEVGNGRVLSFDYFTDGAWRSGIFAASAWTSGREETGATYYGIMEMTGNVHEMAVTIGTPQGRIFRDNHGDGVLDSNGEADVNFWPSGTGKGGGLFGGSWFSDRESLWLNDRRNATIGNAGYFTDVGFRCVRTAP